MIIEVVIGKNGDVTAILILNGLTSSFGSKALNSYRRILSGTRSRF